jgi:hypothetical protein
MSKLPHDAPNRLCFACVYSTFSQPEENKLCLALTMLSLERYSASLVAALFWEKSPSIDRSPCPRPKSEQRERVLGVALLEVALVEKALNGCAVVPGIEEPDHAPKATMIGS